MIWTASQMKNEVDVLEIRLDTIGDLVDRVVLAEATVDQRGRSRDLVFPQHRDRFAKWLDKIEYIIVEDMPKGSSHEDDVKRERHQRDALIRGMPELHDDDLVFVSDLDEIPYPSQLADAIEMGKPLRLPMDLHVYALNWRWLERGCRVGTLGALLKGSDIKEMSVCWAVLWDSRVPGSDVVSGWHLHNQGGVDSILSKVEGQMDKVKDLMPVSWRGNPPDGFMSREWVQVCIATGRDLFGREEFRPTEWVGVDQMPSCVQENPEKYGHMMVPKPDGQDEKESHPRCTCGAIYQAQELWHFPYCALSVVPSTKIYQSDDRKVPRAKSV